MNRQTTSIIQKQVFEISAASSASDLEWQSRAAAYLENIITPAVEACFNKLQFEDKYIIIDKLEIDLGIFTPAGFEKEAAARLKTQLLDKLSAFTKNHPVEKDITTAGHKQKQDDKTQRPQFLNNQQAGLQALLHFLKLGRFPWWYSVSNEYGKKFITKDDDAGNNANTIATGLNQGAVLDDQFDREWYCLLNAEELALLKETLLASADARIRLVNHFSAAWLIESIPALWPVHKDTRELWEITFPVIRSFADAGPLYHQYFWTSLIESGSKPEISIIYLIEKTAGYRTGPALELAKAIHEVCSPQVHNIICRELAQSTGKYIAEKGSPGTAKDEREAERIKSATSSKELTGDNTTLTNRELVERALKEIFQQRSAGEEPAGSGEDDALYIPAAGIVILHPFLEELYKETGLRNGKEWATEESPYRSVQLLSYLAFGETGLPEYQLILFKILAGLDIETALPAESPLTATELNACNELLAAVISHWKALRNTGADGLREGFLQRQGKLTRTDNGHQLMVERLAQDVLLAHLPWGYGMIKLPWMEEMLNVTWI